MRISDWSSDVCSSDLTSSAGLSHDAANPVTPELLAWADIIFVMERVHRSKLSAKFKTHLGSRRVICLEIPDNFAFMQPELIALLQTKVQRHLPSASSPSRSETGPGGKGCVSKGRPRWRPRL